VIDRDFMDAAIEKRDELGHEGLDRSGVEVEHPRVGQEGNLDPQWEIVYVAQQEHSRLAADGKEGVGDFGRVGERWLVEVDPGVVRRGGERRAVFTAADAPRTDPACASSQRGCIRRGRAVVAPLSQPGGHDDRYEGDGSYGHGSLRSLPCVVCRIMSGNPCSHREQTSGSLVTALARAKRLGAILDGEWLICSCGREYNVVDVTTWKSRATIEDTTLGFDAASGLSEDRRARLLESAWLTWKAFQARPVVQGCQISRVVGLFSAPLAPY
jgi:hypothetical protein